MKKYIFSLFVAITFFLLSGSEIRGQVGPGCANCIERYDWIYCLGVCYLNCSSQSGTVVADSYCGGRDNVCCTGGGCSSPCGTLPQWGWCYATVCKSYPVAGWFGQCFYRYSYSYSNCGATDTCDGGSFLKAGQCSPDGCSVGGIYKACCSGSNLVNCTGGRFTGTCPGGSVTRFCGFGGHPSCGPGACAGDPPTVVPGMPTLTPTPPPPPGGNCGGCPWWQQNRVSSWCTDSSTCNNSGLCNKSWRRDMNTAAPGEPPNGYCSWSPGQPDQGICSGCEGNPPPPPPACTPNCSCASSTCAGSTCSNGCGGTCNGTKNCEICGYVTTGLSNRAVSGYSVGIYNNRLGTTSNVTTNSSGKFSSVQVRTGDYYAVRPSTSSFPAGLAGPPRNGSGAASFENQRYEYSPDCASACSCNFKLNSVPKLDSFEVRNVDNSIAVSPDMMNRNHICQNEFKNASLSRRAHFRAVISDEDGGGTVRMVQMRLSAGGVNKTYTVQGIGSSQNVWVQVTASDGQSGLMARVGFNGTNRTVDFRLDFPEAYQQGIYDIHVLAEDDRGTRTLVNGANLIDTLRKFKVWDCKVLASGALYDVASQASQPFCPSIGYSIPYVNEGDFTGFTYIPSPASAGSILSMETESSTSSNYRPVGPAKTNYFVWGLTYRPVFNMDVLQAGDPAQNRMKVGPETCAGPATIIITPDAYVTTPHMRVDFSTIKNQPPWMQAVGGGVMGSGAVVGNAPHTCFFADGCKAVLSLGSVNVDNGLVAGSPLSSVVTDSFGDPNNYYRKNTNFVDTRYNYDYFYDEYCRKLEHCTSASTSSGVGEGVVFVDGSLEIDRDLGLDRFRMVVVRGDIVFTKDANVVNGIFVANGNISMAGESSEQLVINGSLYANGVVNNRSLLPKSGNNTRPPVVVNYRPDFLFNMPEELIKILVTYYDD